MNRSGFTLIELLVVMGVGAIMLAAISSYTVNSIRVSSTLQTSQLLRSDMVMSSQLMSARLREACQVYPDGTVMQLPNIKGAKHGGSLSWTIGTDPFAAVVIPTDTTPRLIAYYLLPRADYRSQAVDEQQIPAGASGDTSLVLMEFSVPVNTAGCTSLPSTIPSDGAQALLVAESVRQPLTTEAAFDTSDDGSVEYKLRFAQNVAGREVVYPPLTADPMTAAIIGRNLP